MFVSRYEVPQMGAVNDNNMGGEWVPSTVFLTVFFWPMTALAVTQCQCTSFRFQH